MARKKKKKAKRKGAPAAAAELSNEALEAEVARGEAAEDFKAMLAAAKALLKRRSDSASDQRVADAYAGRIRQLVSKGLFPEAAALLPLRDRHRGERLSADERKVSLYVLIRSGQWEAAAKGIRSWNDPEAQPFAADLLLLHPPCAATVDPDGGLAGDLSAVHEALAAYDGEEDEAALEALRPLGLKSPFRYWKLLIRGMIAFHGGDEETAVKSLQRIPDGLPLADLAGEYLRILSPGGAAAPPASEGRETADSGSPAAHASALQRAMEAGDIARAFSELGTVIAGFPEEPWLQRAAAAFCWHSLLFSKRPLESRDWFGLKSVLGPFIFDDARFARTLALVFERVGEWEQSVTAWLDFAHSLARGEVAPPGGLPENRVRAQIFLRIARNASKCLLEVSRDPFFFRRLPSAEAFESIDPHLEQAGSLDPGSPEPYLTGVALARDDWEDVDHAFRWAERLVKAFPTHLGGLLAAADLGLQRGVYRKALGFVKKAESLEPLHNEVRAKRSLCLLLSARKRAREFKYELARKDYCAALGSLKDDEATKVRIELGCVELSLGQVEAGRASIDDAVRDLGGGAGPLLRVVVESKRKLIPTKLRKQCLAALKERLSEPEPQQAVELVAVFREYQDTGYLEQDHDEALIAAYVKRCAKMSFSREDAFNLCQFLAAAEKYRTLGTLAGRSVRAYPEDFHFPVYQILAKAETRPAGLRESDEELLQTCKRKASEAGEGRFARFVEEALLLVELLIEGDEEEDEDEDEWDGLPDPFAELLGCLEEMLDVPGARSGSPGRRTRQRKKVEAETPPETPRRPAATQLDLFEDDE